MPYFVTSINYRVPAPGSSMDDKVMLLVGDSLRADSFKKYNKVTGEYKELLPAYTQTPGATFSLLFGRHVSHVYWPTEVNPFDILRQFGFYWPKGKGATFAMFNFFPLVAKLLSEESVVHAMRRSGIKTMVYSQLNVPPLSLPEFDVVEIGDTKQIFSKLSPLSKATLFVLWSLARFATEPHDLLGNHGLINALLDKLTHEGRNNSGGRQLLQQATVRGLGRRGHIKVEKVKGEAVRLLPRLHPHGEYSCGPYRGKMGVHMLTWYYNVKVGEALKLYQVDSVEAVLEYYEKCKKIKKVLEESGIFEILRSAYEECVKLFAEFVKRVEEELVAEGWKVIVTADHPEHFGEDCISGHPPLPPLTRPPLKVPLLLMGAKGVNEVKAYTQIPELAARLLSVDWRAPSKDDVMETIPYMRESGWSIMVEATDWKTNAAHVVDNEGKEAWYGSEELREIIRAHERRSAKERKKLLTKLRIKLRLRKKLAHT